MYYEVNGIEVDCPDCMEGMHSCRECSRYMKDCDGNDSVCMDEGDELRLEEIPSLTEDLLRDVKDFAWDQLEKAAENPAVSFEHEDQSIVNPWTDATARKEMYTDEAMEYYGKENVETFVKKALEHLK